MDWSNFTSRKFLLALAANIVAVVVMFWPKYQSEIVQAVNTGMSLLLMIGASMGWIHEEARIDAAVAVAKANGDTQVRMAMIRNQPARVAAIGDAVRCGKPECPICHTQYMGAAAPPQPQPNIDELVSEVTRILQSVLSGAEADVRTYANRLIMDAYRAAAEPDPLKRDRLLAELAAQAQLLGEVNRLRATNAGWSIVSTAMDFAMRIVVAVLVGYLKAYQSNQAGDPTNETDESWRVGPSTDAGRPPGLR